MKLPAGLETAMSRFDRMSLRERGLVAVAILAVVVMLWTVALWDPISSRRGTLTGELTSLQESMTSTAQALETNAQTDPINIALKQEKALREELADINAKLASKSAGLIPPERMVQVLQDVLTRQHGLTLVSLHNKPVTMLAPPLPPAQEQTQEPTSDGAFVSTDASQKLDAATPPIETGPFVHPVEVVIEGRYLDILAYLHALEALEWRFYWKLLELETLRYPTNRVRLEINTLSMDKDWIGV